MSSGYHERAAALGALGVTRITPRHRNSREHQRGGRAFPSIMPIWWVSAIETELSVHHNSRVALKLLVNRRSVTYIYSKCIASIPAYLISCRADVSDQDATNIMPSAVQKMPVSRYIRHR